MEYRDNIVYSFGYDNSVFHWPEKREKVNLTDSIIYFSFFSWYCNIYDSYYDSVIQWPGKDKFDYYLFIYFSF